MIRRSVVSVSLIALASLVLIPAAALAQSAIAGVVKDTTGAVLPGVTVEASSPALIEKIRTVVTDDQGQYKIVDLRPGVYAVTFTLAGFSTVKREEIELTASFTATVNAEMRVGVLEETVTVSGQSPVVDVQNVVQQRVVTADVIEAIPSGRTTAAMAVLIPGLTVAVGNRPSGQDVGGLLGERQQMAVHGGRNSDLTLYLDGLPYNVLNGRGGTSAYTINIGEVQEFSYEFGAISAEAATGGIRSNMIPKEGGNLFKGTVFANFSNESLQSDNLADGLRARGLHAVNELEKMWDLNPSVGGPIKYDRLWFFGSYRYWGMTERMAEMWYNKTPLAFVYTPDLSRQAIDDAWNTAAGLRLTWQTTPKNKLNIYLFDQHRCQCHWKVGGTIAPEASTVQRNPRVQLAQASWSSPVTNRLLLEAGALVIRFSMDPAREPGVTPDTYAAQELSTGLRFRAAENYQRQFQSNNTFRAALSYVTGSHAFKVGVTLQHGKRWSHREVNGDLNLQLLNGVPRAVIVNATPWDAREHLNAAFGLFAQDQWTIKRLTLNAGVRFDYLNAKVPEQHLPAARFVPARDFAPVPDVPNWTDLSPRLGASYDLFGTGRTALKVALSRYVVGELVEVASANNPVNASVNSATRTWTDANGNFNPECDFLNLAANGECGQLSDANFGKTRITTRYADAVREGFGSRGYDWEITAGLQHELRPGVSVNATYFRRWYGNFTATDNLLVTPTDFDPFCITAPVDARLPGSGSQICGLYDVTPAKFGQVNNLITFAKHFGEQTEVYDGVDLTMNMRLPRGGLLFGGLNTGRSVTNTCFVVDSPQVLRFCEVSPPFLTQVKFLGVFTLPWDLQASGTFQNIPGPEITASYVATSEQIRGSLGRDLASGARGTATVALIAPGTRYETRTNQVDLRVAKIFRVGRTRIKGMVDLYNAFNASPVLVLNTQYGPAWLQPTYILPGRLLKFGGQVDF